MSFAFLQRESIILPALSDCLHLFGQGICPWRERRAISGIFGQRLGGINSQQIRLSAPRGYLRRVQRDRFPTGNGDYITTGLNAGCNRPFDKKLIPRVDIFIHYDHMLAEQNGLAPNMAHHVAHMSGVRMLDGYIHVEPGAARRGNTNVLDSY